MIYPSTTSSGPFGTKLTRIKPVSVPRLDSNVDFLGESNSKLPIKIPSLKLTASLPLKMDGKGILSRFLFGIGLFSGAFAVSFREGRGLHTVNLKRISFCLFHNESGMSWSEITTRLLGEISSPVPGGLSFYVSITKQKHIQNRELTIKVQCEATSISTSSIVVESCGVCKAWQDIFRTFWTWNPR